MLLSKDSSKNRTSFLDEFCLQQQVTMSNHKNSGILDHVITSGDIEVSEPLANFVMTSDRGVERSDLLQKHHSFAKTKALCRKWRNFDLVAIAKNVVALIDRNIPGHVSNRTLSNEVIYLDKNHPLKIKYVRSYKCLFFDNELKTKKRSSREIERTYRKNAFFQAKSRFLS